MQPPGSHPLTATVAPTAPPATILNLRDLGGHRTLSGGTIRRGLVHRSADLARLDAERAATALADLGIRTLYDLRTVPERRLLPERDKVPAGTRYVVADVMRDSASGSPADMYRLIADPRSAEAAFGAGRAGDTFEAIYREFVTLGSARAAFRRLFRGIADGARHPLLFHCTTGKDRTGWASAALLLLLDVPEDIVRADYMASNEALRGVLDPALERFEAAGGDRTVLEPLTIVSPRYLDAALDEVRRAYGSIPGYFALGLGIDDAGQRRLREALVDLG